MEDNLCKCINVAYIGYKGHAGFIDECEDFNIDICSFE